MKYIVSIFAVIIVIALSMCIKHARETRNHFNDMADLSNGKKEVLNVAGFDEAGDKVYYDADIKYYFRRKLDPVSCQIVRDYSISSNSIKQWIKK